MIVKFTFLMKSGKTFDCVEDIKPEQFGQMCLTVKTCMKEGVNGSLLFEDCCVRVGEVAVASWEVLNEQETETSK